MIGGIGAAAKEQAGKMIRIGAAMRHILPVMCLAAMPVFAEGPAQPSSDDAKIAPPVEGPSERAHDDTIPPKGPVTNLPMPRFVSLKANEANVRRGPSLSHRIDWVFTKRGYPLEVIAEYGHWRRVRDVEGAAGWLHYSLISGVRMALVTDSSVDLFARPDTGARLNAQAEKNVLLRLQECSISWCKVSVDGHKGWVLKSGLWGVRSDEVLE